MGRDGVEADVEASHPDGGAERYTGSDPDAWEGPIAAFRPRADFWTDTQFWAPEVHVRDGHSFMVATFASSNPAAGPRGVQALLADESTGPFVPWSDGSLTPRDMPCLYGTLFIDDAGAPRLVYSRGAEGVPRGARSRRWRDVRPSALGGPPGANRAAYPVVHGVSRVVEQATVVPGRGRAPRGAAPGQRPAVHRRTLLRPLRQLHAAHAVVELRRGRLRDGRRESANGLVTSPLAQHTAPGWARNGGHGMIFTAPDGVDRLVFHWPNDTPNERVKLVGVDVSDAGIRLVD